LDTRRGRVLQVLDGGTGSFWRKKEDKRKSGFYRRVSRGTAEGTEKMDGNTEGAERRTQRTQRTRREEKRNPRPARKIGELGTRNGRHEEKRIVRVRS
jgi:hypothetical protein